MLNHSATRERPNGTNFTRKITLMVTTNVLFCTGMVGATCGIVFFNKHSSNQVETLTKGA